jgi:hypothetical protein
MLAIALMYAERMFSKVVEEAPVIVMVASTPLVMGAGAGVATGTATGAGVATGTATGAGVATGTATGAGAAVGTVDGTVGTTTGAEGITEPEGTLGTSITGVLVLELQDVGWENGAVLYL